MTNTRFRQRSIAASKTSSYFSRVKFLLLIFLFVLLIFVLVYGINWCWYSLQNSNRFEIDRVVVRGQLFHVTPTQVAKIVKQYATGNFFSLNLSLVESHLLEIPWVTQVSFRRIWPHTLAVEITEQIPVARFGDRGVLNAQGEIFYPDLQTIPKNLPFLSAPINQRSSILQLFHDLMNIAHPLSLSIQALVLSEDQNWITQLNNNIVVVLGTDDMLPHFQRLARVYTKLIQTSPKQIARIDLRYPNGFAVEYRKNI